MYWPCYLYIVRIENFHPDLAPSLIVPVCFKKKKKSECRIGILPNEIHYYTFFVWQMIWAETNKVGCAYSRCTPLRRSNGRQLYADAWYLACNYGPKWVRILQPMLTWIPHKTLFYHNFTCSTLCNCLGLFTSFILKSCRWGLQIASNTKGNVYNRNRHQKCFLKMYKSWL